jgi:hypothetical protein
MERATHAKKVPKTVNPKNIVRPFRSDNSPHAIVDRIDRIPMVIPIAVDRVSAIQVGE